VRTKIYTPVVRSQKIVNHKLIDKITRKCSIPKARIAEVGPKMWKMRGKKFI